MLHLCSMKVEFEIIRKTKRKKKTMFTYYKKLHNIFQMQSNVLFCHKNINNNIKIFKLITIRKLHKLLKFNNNVQNQIQYFKQFYKKTVLHKLFKNSRFLM